ncbi:MAG TPA: hypothetical protein VG873_02470 [Burkholderiales bacterium]|nr:hypothetical protein [Burkholderiales bacterium]
MKNVLVGFSAVLVLAFASAAHARFPVPLDSHENVPIVVPSGQAPAIETVRKAILNGGMGGARKWFPTSASEGRLRLTYNVRSHSVSVEVTYSQKAYSIAYASSVNMKYGLDASGTPVIHPFYNTWVRELRTAIDYELTKL